MDGYITKEDATLIFKYIPALDSQGCFKRIDKFLTEVFSNPACAKLGLMSQE